jgi:hypothetical protein
MDINALINAAQSGEYLAASTLSELPLEAFESKMQWFRCSRLVGSATHALVDGVRFDATPSRSEPTELKHEANGRRVLIQFRANKLFPSDKGRSRWYAMVRDGSQVRDYEFLTFTDAAAKAVSLV